MKKCKGMRFRAVLAAMLILSMTFVPAVNANIEPQSNTIKHLAINDPIIEEKLKTLQNDKCKECDITLLEKKEDYSIYKAKVKNGQILLKITENIAEDGSVTGKIQYIQLSANKEDIMEDGLTESEISVLAWDDIVVRYETFLDSLESTNHGTHHYAGVTFELNNDAGAFAEGVLLAALCTLIGKNPYIGFACGVVATAISIYWPHEKIYTVGSYDYDYGLNWSGDGINLGWHVNANDLVDYYIYPYHRLTW